MPRWLTAFGVLAHIGAGRVNGVDAEYLPAPNVVGDSAIPGLQGDAQQKAVDFEGVPMDPALGPAVDEEALNLSSRRSNPPGEAFNVAGDDLATADLGHFGLRTVPPSPDDNVPFDPIVTNAVSRAADRLNGAAITGSGLDGYVRLPDDDDDNGDQGELLNESDNDGQKRPSDSGGILDGLFGNESDGNRKDEAAGDGAADKTKPLEDDIIAVGGDAVGGDEVANDSMTVYDPMSNGALNGIAADEQMASGRVGDLIGDEFKNNDRGVDNRPADADLVDSGPAGDEAADMVAGSDSVNNAFVLNVPVAEDQAQVDDDPVPVAVDEAGNPIDMAGASVPLEVPTAGSEEDNAGMSIGLASAAGGVAVVGSLGVGWVLRRRAQAQASLTRFGVQSGAPGASSRVPNPPNSHSRRYIPV